MAPQHLQQADAFHAELLHARLTALAEATWGVIEIDVDGGALQLGDVRLSRFAAVFADGLVAAFDDASGEAPPQRSIRGHFPPTASVLEVFVAAPREREGSANYGYPGQESARRPRWLRSQVEVRDATAGDADVEVELGAPNLEILFGDEVRGDVEAIKVAEITRNAGGVPVLVEDYVPPIFRVGASPWLMREVGTLLGLMAAQQRHLAESGRQRDSANAEILGADVSRLLLLGGLGGQIPVLRAAALGGPLSPFALYVELARFAGFLGTFTAEGMLAATPRYEPADLRATFSGLFRQIAAVLGATALEAAIRIPLERRADGPFVGRLRDERVLSSRRFFLAVHADLPEAQLADQFPRLAKVAGAADVLKFVQAAMPGIPLQICHRPPAQISVRAGNVYFTLDTAHPLWRGVISERAIAVYAPPSLAASGLSLSLQVIPEDEA